MFQICFENENFVIADKPCGVLSVPSQFGKEDPREVISLGLQEQLGCRLWPVHRLDFEVSGIILLAKDSNSHRKANEWFEAREIQKTYEAWGEGPSPETGSHTLEWTSKIHRGKKRSFESPHGKLAVTRAFWQNSGKINDCLYQCWRLEPLTGRPHQLRFEMAKFGHPILGDKLYGSTRDFLPNGIALRAIELDFSSCKKSSHFGLPQKIFLPGLESLAKLKD